MSVSQLRRSLRLQRRVLPAAQREAAALQLLQHFLSLPFIASAPYQTVAGYWAVDGEIDPSLILKWCWQQQKKCYLPVIHHKRDKELRFAPYYPNTLLRLNRFNIPEPISDPTVVLYANDVDLMLLPLVAFDRAGHRLGRGGGFYDYTLRHKAQQHRPVVIGIGYDFQCASTLVPNATDVNLDAVVTEKQIYLFRNAINEVLVT